MGAQGADGKTNEETPLSLYMKAQMFTCKLLHFLGKFCLLDYHWEGLRFKLLYLTYGSLISLTRSTAKSSLLSNQSAI